jgi:hypothetical protein
VDLVHAVVGNSDLLCAQVKIRDRIIMKVIIAEYLIEKFKTSLVFC